jgi:glycerophosphoryl diester phosphodiesterase
MKPSRNRRELPLVIAHRGASAAHPPGNTIPAFAASAALGADWVELDVHLSADGAMVVHHDADLADGRAIGSISGVDLPGEVPLLAAALAACGGLGVNVEIKPDGPSDLRDRLIDSVIDLLRRSGEPERFLVTSFDATIIGEVRIRASELPTGFLAMEIPSGGPELGRISMMGHVAINPWFGKIDATLVENAHALGLVVNAWTVDEPDQMRRLVDIGIDGIITNVPDVCQSVLSEFG